MFDTLLASRAAEVIAFAEAGGSDTALLYDSFGDDRYIGGKPVGGVVDVRRR